MRLRTRKNGGAVTRLVPEAARGINWLGHSDIAGRSDGVQIMVNKGFAFIGHPFTGGGASVIDVQDPRAPRPVNFIAVHPRSWALHFQTFDDLLLLAEEFNFIAHKPVRQWHDPDHSGGLRVYDIANPAEPRQIGFMPVEGLGLHRVWWA